MNQWNFYLSGILYGVLENRQGWIYHRPLDVYTGQLAGWQELGSGNGWYRDLGKMDVREALLGLEDYEAGIQGRKAATEYRGAAGKGCGQFTTRRGERFERRDAASFVQRNIKFPKDLILDCGNIAAFVTPYRDQCAVLVRDGLEDRTILARWADLNRSPLCAVKPPVTVMIPMRDLTITGEAYAELYISSDCEDTDLVARITDVDERGRSMKLADGIISVRYRNQFQYPELMEPGRVYLVRIRTTKLSHTFLKGHRLRFTTTSSASNFIFPNRNTRDGFNSVTTRVAHNSIHRGGKHASRVVLRQE